MRRIFDSVSRGLLLIALGIIFFLLNYGFLSWGLWVHVIDLWPLILILAGIGLLFNRMIPLSMVLLIFLLSIVGYSIVVGDKPIPERINSFQNSLGQTGSIDVLLPLEVKKANVDLELGGSQVQVKALQSESNQSEPRLMTGNYKLENWGSRTGKNDDPVIIKQSGDTITANLSAATAGKGARNLRDISLNLSPKVRYDLELEAGAINGNIDLSQLLVDKLKISTGASDFELQFGDTGIATEGKIDSGASKLTLVVPENVGLKIRLDGVATSTDFMGSGLLLENKSWVSPNFAQAKSKINLEISTAAGSVRLERPKINIQ